jgi:hypothetical protein
MLSLIAICTCPQAKKVKSAMPTILFIAKTLAFISKSAVAYQPA